MTIPGFLALVYGIGVLISMRLMLRRNCEYIRDLMVDASNIAEGKLTKQDGKTVALAAATTMVVAWPLRVLGRILAFTIDLLPRRKR